MTAIHESIEDYLAAQAAEGKARCTLQVYGARLRRFAEWCARRGKRSETKLASVASQQFIPENEVLDREMLRLEGKWGLGALT